MATIGNIVIGMSARTDGLSKDLNKAGNSVKGFGKQAEESAAKASTTVKQMAAAAASAAASTALSVASKGWGLLFNTLKIGLPIAGAVVVALGGLAAASGNAIDSAGDAADRFSTTTSNLLALRYAAKLTGSETEALDGALTKLGPNLGRAATEGGPAADAINQIGLNAKELASTDSTEAFLRIVEGLKGVENPAQRAALAMDIFGKGGVGVLGSIAAGPEELRRLSDEFKTFGGVSESTRQNIGAMYDSFDRVYALVGALGGQIAGQLSPYIAAAGQYLFDLGKAGLSSGEAVMAGSKTMIESVAVALDIVDTLRLAFFYVQKTATQGASIIVSGLGSIATAIDYVLEKTTGLKSGMGDTFAAIARGLDELAAKQADELTKTASATSYGDRARKAFDEIGKAALDARSQVDNSIKKYGEVGESVAESLKTVEDATKKQFGLADQLFESTRTPLEKFQAELTKIENLKATGFIDNDLAARAAEKAKTDFAGNAPQRGAALELGSQEARKAILDFRGQSQGKSSEDLAKASKETARNSAIANALMERLIGKVDALKVDAEPVF